MHRMTTGREKGVRNPSVLPRFAAAFLIMVTVLGTGARAHAGARTLADQVAAVLYEESAQGRIRVAVLDFSVSPAPGTVTPSEKEMNALGTRFTDDFTADILNRIKEAGKREKIIVIDRSMLDDFQRERKATGSAERAALAIGRRAGIDVIVTGTLQQDGGSAAATAKVIRVKDGEILDIVKQSREEKPPAAMQAPVPVVETVEHIEIGAYKALPLKLPSDGTITVTVDVLQGNPIDVTVIPAAELGNYEQHKEFKQASLFTASKKKSYKRSAEFSSGEYYLILRDSSLGIFSVQSSRIKVQVTLAPYTGRPAN